MQDKCQYVDKKRKITIYQRRKMNNIELSQGESSPEAEQVDYEKEAQSAILSFEVKVLALYAENITKSPEFADFFGGLQENLQQLANTRSGPDASNWYGYYLTQTYGILSEIFPEFKEDFDSSFDHLSYTTGVLRDEELRRSWNEKIAQMITEPVNALELEIEGKSE